MLYRLYDLTISSEKLLPWVPLSAGTEADVRIRFNRSPRSPHLSPEWFMKWELPGKDPWLHLGRIDGGYLLRFADFADFFVSSGGSEVEFIPLQPVPEETIQHLLLDQVIPLVINLRGGEALHASAVLAHGGVVAFAGPAGSGKSTLAGSLVKLGYPFFSDDCLRLKEEGGNIYAIPAYPGFRLWEDAEKFLFGKDGNPRLVAHYTSKLRVSVERRPDAYCEEPEALLRLYDIIHSPETQEESRIVIKKLSPREGFMALVRCTFRLDITDRKMLTRQFNFLKEVASKISVRQLSFPRNFDVLSSVCDFILEDCGGNASNRASNYINGVPRSSPLPSAGEGEGEGGLRKCTV